MTKSRLSRAATSRMSHSGKKKTTAMLVSAATSTRIAAPTAAARLRGRQSKAKKQANSKDQIELVTLASDSVPTTGSSSTIAASEARR